MRKLIVILSVFLMFLSCSTDENKDISAKMKDYQYTSDQGNSLTITLPDRVLYSYEKIELIFEVEYLDNFVPVVPDWSSLSDSMSIIHIKEENTLNKKRIVMTLDSRLPGEYLINPLSVDFHRDGLAADSISSEFIPLTINSSLIEGEADLIDDFDFLQIKKNYSFLLIIFAASLFFILLAAFLIYRKRKQIKLNFHLPEKDYRAIIANLDDENIIDIYSLLSETIKEFLDNKLFLSIQSQTTEEIIRSTKRNPMIEEWLKIQLYSFLQRADETRFGSLLPDDERVSGDILFCRDFIDYIEKKVKEEIVL